MSTHLLELNRPAGTPLHFHVHLPRTAGSALQRTWTERGGRFFPLPDRLTDPGALEQGLREALDVGAPVLIGGHFPFRLLRPALQSGDVVYAAVREPVERAYSLFRYAVTMCQGGAIVNYPGDHGTRDRWNDDWRTNVAASGLDPDDFSLEEFLDSGLCADDAFRAFFGYEADAAALGEEMRENGFVVLHSGAAGGLLGRRPVNRTTSGKLTISAGDRRLLGERLPLDVAAFASINAAFPPARRRLLGAFGRR